MSSPEITRAAVIGAGTMGAGIAQVFAGAGVAVTLVDVREESLAKGVAGVAAGLARLVAKGKIEQPTVDALLARISTSTDLAASARDADLAIEAVFENLEVKSSLIRQLDAALPGSAIIATNTSSISVTRLCAVAANPARVVGLHFFNPAPVMPLVEVVRGLQTDDATVAAVTALARRCGKTPVEAQDSPGFVGNRILLPMINEAIGVLAEGVASKEAIDEVMKLGMGHPMGPLALGDLIGLDVCLDILEVLHREIGDDRYRPSQWLRRRAMLGMSATTVE